ncbi:MAG: Putative beta-lactamase class C protein [Candidatus Magnetoglobus multicellularis str. Araruama]|uniref:Beta-lactamase class C protein n=1 Tax=Candidatus Magnetoglobus multicellularis str. Araruama TaxID=890399 RepID=A0A1V1NSZ6_9BACT|nr:MAG: Putative beta-lactamase class C protein [Candidatus Magnetoglobus multicellularis str. Araruama]
MKLNQPIIDHHMSKAIKAGIFPGASLLVACQHEILHCGYYGRQQLSGKPVDSLTIYDLASLTKPLATSLALMHMLQAGILQLDQKLSTIFPECAESDKGNITVLQLLCHQSGLPAHRPYFEKLIHCPPKNRSNQLLSMIFDEPLIYQSGTKTIYSDLGFMVLNAAIERLNGFRLDTYIYNNIYHPLGVKDLFY